MTILVSHLVWQREGAYVINHHIQLFSNGSAIPPEEWKVWVSPQTFQAIRLPQVKNLEDGHIENLYEPSKVSPFKS